MPHSRKRQRFIAQVALAIVTIAISTSFANGQEHEENAPDSQLAQLKFRRLTNLIIVKARINGSKELNLVLDTGASTSLVLETDVARQLGMKLGPAMNVGQTSSGKPLTAHFVSSASISLGGHSTKLSRVLVAPCRGHARRMLGEEVHGILGTPYLNQVTVEIDYEDQLLEIHDPQKYEYHGNGETLDLEFDPTVGNLPFTTAYLESGTGGRRKVRMLVDSGGCTDTSGGLGLQDDIGALVVDNAPKLPTKSVTGLGNSSSDTEHKSYLTRLEGMQVGSFQIDRPVVSCGSTHNFNLFGSEVLRRFDVVFDYTRKRMILEPNASFDDQLKRDSSGMMLVASEDDTSAREVFFVNPDSPAAALGIQAGDTLVTVNGKPASEMSLVATRALFFDPGKEHTLKIKRGNRIIEVRLTTRVLL